MKCQKHVRVMWSIIYGCLILKGIHAKVVKKRGVMDNLNDGLKVAGQMFGINTAADVANLVAKAFSNNNSNRNKPDLFSFLQNGLKLSLSKPDGTEDDNKQNNETQETQQSEFPTKASAGTPSRDTVDTSSFITGLLRLVGFDVSKLGALAINGIIMIASAIGNAVMGTMKSQPKLSTPDDDHLFNRNPSFSKTKNNNNDNVNVNEREENGETGPEEKYSAPNDHQPRAVNDTTTIEWFLQNSPNKIKGILNEATHSDLTDKLIDMITSYETEQDQAPCLKLLVCKSSPFIWGMQTSIRERIKPKTNKESTDTNDEDLKNNGAKKLFNVKSFFTHLPSIDQYREHSVKCEHLYSHQCNVAELYDKTN